MGLRISFFVSFHSSSIVNNVSLSRLFEYCDMLAAAEPPSICADVATKRFAKQTERGFAEEILIGLTF
jgi:hypothetical protein